MLARARPLLGVLALAGISLLAGCKSRTVATAGTGSTPLL